MSGNAQDTEGWDIARMMQWMQSYLGSHGDSNPRISTQWLISESTGLSRTELFMQMDRPLSKDELDSLRSGVKRRAAGEPLQYITGEAPFRYLNIKVAPGVLIPRPETEVLVSELLARLPKPEKIRSNEFLAEMSSSEAVGESDDDNASTNVCENDEPTGTDAIELKSLLVADLCTGSGCIACSLASEHPLIHVIATDISDLSVDLAKKNVDTLDLGERVGVLKGDLGESITEDLIGKFDAVISNPPYIPTDVLASLSCEVADFEPELALDGGKDGLDIFRRIVLWSASALKPEGILAVELHETTLDDAYRFAQDNGFTDLSIVKDLAGKDRVLIGRRRG